MLPTTGSMTSVSETQRHDLAETPTVTSLPASTPSCAPRRPGIPDRLGMGLDTRADSGGALGKRKEKHLYGGGRLRTIHGHSQGRRQTQTLFSFLCRHSSPGTLTPQQQSNPKPKAVDANSTCACTRVSPQGGRLSSPGKKKSQTPRNTPCLGRCHLS